MLKSLKPATESALAPRIWVEDLTVPSFLLEGRHDAWLGLVEEVARVPDVAHVQLNDASRYWKSIWKSIWKSWQATQVPF
jgi:hypothetical protein